MKKILIPVLLFLLLLFIAPGTCLNGARAGLLLWFNTIIPTLFPFILITNIIREIKGFRYFEKLFSPVIQRLFKTDKGGSYPVITGFLCGYPMGAKAIADTYALGHIHQKEANYLLTFCNQPSPIYLMNYVAISTLAGIVPAWHLLLISLITAYLTSFITRIFLKRRAFNQNFVLRPQGTSVENGFFDRCIVSASLLLVKIGGYMILFSILSQCIQQLTFLPPLLTCIVGGLMEQTTGLGLLAASSFTPVAKTALAMVFSCFGGLSITAQTYSVIHSQGLSIKYYVLGKILTAMIALCLTILYGMIIPFV